MKKQLDKVQASDDDQDKDLKKILDSFDESAEVTLSQRKEKYLKRIEAAASITVSFILSDTSIDQSNIYAVAAELAGKKPSKLKSPKNNDDLTFAEIALITGKRVKEQGGDDGNIYSAALSVLTCRFGAENEGKKLTRFQKEQIAKTVTEKTIPDVALIDHDIAEVQVIEETNSGLHSVSQLGMHDSVLESVDGQFPSAFSAYPLKFFSMCLHPVTFGKKMIKRSMNNKKKKGLKEAVSIIVSSADAGDIIYSKSVQDVLVALLQSDNAMKEASDYERVFAEMALITATRVKELGGDKDMMHAAAVSVLKCKFFDGSKKALADMIAMKVLSESSLSADHDMPLETKNMKSTGAYVPKASSKNTTKAKTVEQEDETDAEEIEEKQRRKAKKKKKISKIGEGSKRGDDDEREISEEESNIIDEVRTEDNDDEDEDEPKRDDGEAETSKRINYLVKLQSGSSLIVKHVLKGKENVNDVVDAVIYVVAGYNGRKEKVRKTQHYKRDRTFILMAIITARHVKRLGGSEVAMESTVLSILSCRGLKKYKLMELDESKIYYMAERIAKNAMLSYSGGENALNKDDFEDSNSVESNTILMQGYSTEMPSPTGAGCCLATDFDEEQTCGRLASSELKAMFNEKSNRILYDDITRKIFKMCKQDTKSNRINGVTTSYDI